MKFEKLLIALSELLGQEGREIATRVAKGHFSQKDYDLICENIIMNKRRSIVKYFGTVHYFFLMYSKKVHSPFKVGNQVADKGNRVGIVWKVSQKSVYVKFYDGTIEKFPFKIAKESLTQTDK